MAKKAKTVSKKTTPKKAAAPKKLIKAAKKALEKKVAPVATATKAAMAAVTKVKGKEAARARRSHRRPRFLLEFRKERSLRISRFKTLPVARIVFQITRQESHPLFLSEG